MLLYFVLFILSFSTSSLLCYTPILKTFQVKENKGIVICFHVFIVVQACPPLGRNCFGRFFILSIQATLQRRTCGFWPSSHLKIYPTKRTEPINPIVKFWSQFKYNHNLVFQWPLQLKWGKQSQAAHQRKQKHNICSFPQSPLSWCDLLAPSAHFFCMESGSVPKIITDHLHKDQQ